MLPESDGFVDPDALEAAMRAGEAYHRIALPPATWPIVRVDGRSFSRLTESRFAKPFDPAFSDLMVATATALVEELGGLFAYTESDEISVLLPARWDLFGRSLEKVVSISAAVASAAFTAAAGAPAHFDSRVWLGDAPAAVLDYFRWRRADCRRCAINGWTYWTLRQAGERPRQVTRLLDHRTTAWKVAFLAARGIDFDAVPAWQRDGIGIVWETYEKSGFNPQTGATVVTQRRRLRVDRTLPPFAPYLAGIEQVLAAAATGEGVG